MADRFSRVGERIIDTQNGMTLGIDSSVIILNEAWTENERLREQNTARAEYIKALEEECGSLSAFAYSHGFRSTRYEEGRQLRERISAFDEKPS